ncbi:hypothetical protein [Corynebacterium sp. HMSC055D05]|nr:hypothetical protein [Corynebacterium sp. HMSC055D05]MDK8822550.1 hypothetical protein [Corynebacterium coyleae]
MSSGTSTGAGNVLVVGVLAELGVDVDGREGPRVGVGRNQGLD